MSVVPFTCPRCGGLFQLDALEAGRRVPCPACHGLISVPPLGLLGPRPTAPPIAPPVIAAEVEPPPVELIPLTCPTCSGLFQVATTLAGSRVACPNCNQLVMAPARLASAPNEPPPANTSLAPVVPHLVELPLPAPPPIELSPKQRAHRRQTRNLILWFVCLAILIAVLWLLR
jgi:DNA-directed RNA polymerase subunit RPC12/RpoP